MLLDTIFLIILALIKPQVDAVTCEDVPLGSFIPSTENCVDYYQCLPGTEVLGSCPDKFLFNFELQMCDYPENVDCDDEPPIQTTDVPDTTSYVPPETTIPDDGEESLIECLDDGAYFASHPSSCSKYFLCFHGVPSMRTCPLRYHFDNYKQTCVARENTDCRQEDPVCPEYDDPLHPTFLPHPHFCSKYFLCFDGELLRYECYEDDAWDQVNETCAPKAEVGCHTDEQRTKNIFDEEYSDEDEDEF